MNPEISSSSIAWIPSIASCARSGACALALLAAACSDRAPERAVRPQFPPKSLNVVLITLDTVRADRLPVYGHTGIDTPAIDALAREGIRFDNASSTVGFTLPAHSSILTGVYPPRHGVRENVGHTLGNERPTVAERLRDAGYATAGFVSAFVLDSRWGIARGFDEYFDDFDPQAIVGSNMASAQRDGAETVAAATAWLDSRPKDRPFFVWIHLYDAHDPYRPPEPFASRYPGKPYEAEIAYVDSLVGRFRSAVEQRGLGGDTAWVLTSDHGEGLGEHGEQFHGFFVYDTTMHVPLIVRLPGGALAGRTVATAVSHVDVAPTVVEIAGAKTVPDFDGTSLFATAVAETDATRAVYSESLYPLLHYGWAPLRALRDSERKYIEAPTPELYLHRTDPAEKDNVVRAERPAAAELRRELAELRARIDGLAKPAAKPSDIDEEALAQLAALGYMAGAGGVSLADEHDEERADPKERIRLHQSIMAAQSALGAGNLPAARRALESALAEDPDILDAHQMLGGIAAQEERWADAVPAFQRALALDASHKASLFGLANAYRRLGRDDEALVGFERLLTLAPQDSKAALAAAEILTARGQRRTAIGMLEKASTGRDAPPILANQLGELLALEGRPVEARAAFERALAANAELVQPHFNLASLAEESGDLPRALRLYEETVAIAPKHFQAIFNLGRLRGATGDRAAQIDLWQRAIDVNPEFVRGRYYLAKLLMDTGGDLSRAEALVRDGLARDDKHVAGPLGYFLLADILNRRGADAEARAALEAGRRVESTSKVSRERVAERPASR